MLELDLKSWKALSLFLLLMCGFLLGPYDGEGRHTSWLTEKGLEAANSSFIEI